MLHHHLPDILKSFENVKIQRPQIQTYQKGMIISMANAIQLNSF